MAKIKIYSKDSELAMSGAIILCKMLDGIPNIKNHVLMVVDKEEKDFKSEQVSSHFVSNLASFKVIRGEFEHLLPTLSNGHVAIIVNSTDVENIIVGLLGRQFSVGSITMVLDKNDLNKESLDNFEIQVVNAKPTITNITIESTSEQVLKHFFELVKKEQMSHGVSIKTKLLEGETEEVARQDEPETVTCTIDRTINLDTRCRAIVANIHRLCALDIIETAKAGGIPKRSTITVSYEMANLFNDYCKGFIPLQQIDVKSNSKSVVGELKLVGVDIEVCVDAKKEYDDKSIALPHINKLLKIFEE